jgi:hypothetical protein
MSVATSAMLGPISLVALAIAGLTAGITYLNDEYETFQKNNAAATVSENQQYIGTLVAGLGTNQKKSGLSKSDFIRKETAEVNKALQDAAAANDAALRSGGKVMSIQDLLLRKQAIEEYSGAGRTSQTTKKALTGAAKPGKATSMPKTTAQGSKAVTINVSIGDLIKTFNINTTNIKEGATKLREQVTGALMGAINDFQITAGQ